MKKIPLFLTRGLPALAGMALFAATASAQTVTFNPGDLLLGFHENGVATDYEVDIGQAGKYLNATTPFTLSGLGNTSQDLITAFGATWFSSPVLWGVIGTTDVSGTLFGLPNNTIFASKAENTSGVQSTPWTESPSGQQSTTRGVIQTITGEMAAGNGSFNGSTSTSDPSVGGGSAVGTFQSASSDVNSWSSANPPNGTTANSNGVSFKKFSPTIEGSFTNGTGNADGAALDLYELLPHATNPLENGAFLGTFTIDNSADITFTPAVAAVPEPPTWALLPAGAGALFVLSRRRGKPRIS